MNGDHVDLLDEVMSRVARTAPPAPIDELVTRARRSRRRHRLRVGGAAMATLAVAVVAAVSVAALGRGNAGPSGVVTVTTTVATSTSSTVLPAPTALAAHTVVFSAGGGRVQQLNIDTGGPPTTLPVTWPPSLGGPDAPLAISAPAVDRSRTRIAFVVGDPRDSGAGAIAVANVDGSSARALTKGPNDAAPAWSWDGSQIAFVRATSSPGAGTGSMIWTMNSDGTDQRSLGVEASSASWSPDGTTLAIQNIGEPVRMGLLTIATGHVRWVTPADGSVEQFTPAWSPDGNSIVYGQRFAYSAQPAGLFVANADGSNARRLTSCNQGCEDDSEPTWSSDGSAIAFVRYMDSAPSTPQVYVVAPSGGPVRQLTSGAEPHDSPSW